MSGRIDDGRLLSWPTWMRLDLNRLVPRLIRLNWHSLPVCEVVAAPISAAAFALTSNDYSPARSEATPSYQLRCAASMRSALQSFNPQYHQVKSSTGPFENPSPPTSFMAGARSVLSTPQAHVRTRISQHLSPFRRANVTRLPRILQANRVVAHASYLPSFKPIHTISIQQPRPLQYNSTVQLGVGACSPSIALSFPTP
jgi:hypothetical protein